METQQQILEMEDFERYLIPNPDSYLVLLKNNEDQKTAGGIILPTQKDKTQTFGIVVGRGRNMDFANIGDKVILSSLSGVDLEDFFIQGVKYNLRKIRDTDILAIDCR